MGHDPGLRGAARAGDRTAPIRPRGPHRGEIRAHRREINVTVSLMTCGHAACEVPRLVAYDKPMVRSGPETTRTELLYAAALEIAERGYSGASFSSVAARLGLTKGAFAYHFPTKQALAVALMEEFDETFSNAVAHAREDFPSDDLRTALFALREIEAKADAEPVVAAAFILMCDPQPPVEEIHDTFRR